MVADIVLNVPTHTYVSNKIKKAFSRTNSPVTLLEVILVSSPKVLLEANQFLKANHDPSIV